MTPGPHTSRIVLFPSAARRMRTFSSNVFRFPFISLAPLVQALRLTYFMHQFSWSQSLCAQCTVGNSQTVWDNVRLAIKTAHDYYA